MENFQESQRKPNLSALGLSLIKQQKKIVKLRKKVLKFTWVR